ncbi:MAG TPA: transglycosylase family protein [Solirubrobacterales bacterium]|nr:transglycosylase family protein [Solirubrobacterales bacterium]
MPRTPATEAGHRRRLVALACAAVCACALLLASGAGATDVDALQGKVEEARGQASAIAAKLREKQGELAVAEQEAAAAAARERELSGLLATGQERAAELAGEVERTEDRLAEERDRLRRARAALAQRLVAIYMSGTPDTTGVVLGSDDYAGLLTSAEYLRQIEESDAELAARVEEVSDAVRHELELVAESKARADAYNARLSAAHSQISVVHSNAEAAASQLQSIASAREASLATLKSNIGGWVEDIEAAQAASQAAAEATVERWLGGPYSIPTYIVMCESGGNYSALNPSSGAGGAYQILPSTWALYGGKGAPHEASKAEQDAIAAQIWADSGSSAWVCS